MKLTVPDGWRIVNGDEIIKNGDEYSTRMGWSKACSSIGTTPAHNRNRTPIFKTTVWITPDTTPVPEKEWVNPWD